MRHLQNSQFLTLYASLSCGAGFLARLVPAFFIPLMLLRVAILVYCFVVIFKAENNREVATLVGVAMMVGFLGSQLDLIEIEVKYNLAGLVTKATTVLVFAALLGVGYYQFKSSNK